MKKMLLLLLIIPLLGVVNKKEKISKTYVHQEIPTIEQEFQMAKNRFEVASSRVEVKIVEIKN